VCLAGGDLPHEVNFTGPSRAWQAQHRGLSWSRTRDGEVAEGCWRSLLSAWGGRSGSGAGKGGKMTGGREGEGLWVAREAGGTSATSCPGGRRRQQ
jgi:hypothetical protein